MKDKLIILPLLLVGFLFMGASSYLQSALDGFKAYIDKQYAESAEHFNDAIEQGGDPDLLKYDKGNALYKAGDYDGASSSYRSALDEGTKSADEYYNLGNALAQQGLSMAKGDLKSGMSLMEEAIKAYEDALGVDYTDADSVHNLEWAKKALEDMKKTEAEKEGDQKGDSGSSDKGDKDQKGKGDQDQQQGGDQQDKGDQSQGDNGDQDKKQDGQDQQQGKQDPADKQDQNKDQSQKGQGGEQPSKKDDLNMSDQQVERLLDYFEQRERQQESPTWDDDLTPGVWEDVFGNAPVELQDKDSWIDW